MICDSKCCRRSGEKIWCKKNLGLKGLRAKCYHCFKKSDASHIFRFSTFIISGQIIDANCSCKAGKVGYRNHVLALMFKACKFSSFDSTSTDDLCHNEQPDVACTSQL